MKSLLLGTILGGMVAFIWSGISWEVLPRHEKALRTFQDEDAVGRVIAEHTLQSGVYLFPGGPSPDGMTSEQKKAAQAALMEKMQKGPVMFAAVRRGGFGSYTRGMVTQVLCEMVAALLLTWLLLQTSGLSYGRRVAFLAVAGLCRRSVSDRTRVSQRASARESPRRNKTRRPRPRRSLRRKILRHRSPIHPNCAARTTSSFPPGSPSHSDR